MRGETHTGQEPPSEAFWNDLCAPRGAAAAAPPGEPLVPGRHGLFVRVARGIDALLEQP